MIDIAKRITLSFVFFSGLGLPHLLSAEEKPKVVLIMADDMGYGDCGAYNSESKIPTPHIDQLAKEGLLFTDAHAAASTCTPSRYGLLTGINPVRTGVLNMIKRSGIPVYPQPHKALRDVRINELERQGFRKQEIDAWIGNTEAVRNKHYSAISVTKADRQKADRQKALGIVGAEKSVGETAKSVGIVCAENTQSDPKKLVQQMLEEGKGRELLEMLEKALKENGPADKQVHPEGFEPPTLGSEDRCSIQLSYGRVETNFSKDRPLVHG